MKLQTQGGNDAVTCHGRPVLLPSFHQHNLNSPSASSQENCFCLPHGLCLIAQGATFDQERFQIALSGYPYKMYILLK